MRKRTSTHSPKKHMDKIVKLSRYKFKVQPVGADIYRFIPIDFDCLPDVPPFIAIDDSYWLLECKPEELEGYIVKLSKKIGHMDLESMSHFYERLAINNSNPLQSEPVETYHKPSKFVLAESKRQQAVDNLERGKFHHRLYKYGTFWDFLAGVWWGDHFNN